MNDESTCQAILNQYDPQLESYFDDESTLFRDLVNDAKSLSGFPDHTSSAFFTKPAAAAAAAVPAPSEPAVAPPPLPQPAVAVVSVKPQAIVAPVKSNPPPPPPPPPPSKPSSAPPSALSAKTPQRKTKAPPASLVVPPPPPARTATKPPAPKPLTNPQSTAEAKKKNALRSTLSAFLHLHQPHMTRNEQEALMNKYEGKDCALWAMLERKFGVGSVPRRFLEGGELAMRGSAKLALVPMPSRDGEMDRIMREQGLDLQIKETMLRTMTVEVLLGELRLRW
ncbi:hypothetical protein BASA82_000648, partial [Batrachochytrium salamandrivorans]